MTEQELVKQWLQPGAIVPVDANTTRILITSLRERLAQPEQEPVAWIYRGNLHPFDPSDWAVEPVTPLYTTPPRREWVGLTKEEAKEISMANRPYVVDMIAALEARLKEKNT